MNISRFSFCLILLLAQAAVAPEMEAQQGAPPGAPTPSYDEVVVFSYIGPGAGSGITTYSATEMGADVTAYYDAQAYGYLYQGTSVLTSGSASGNPVAEGTLSASSAAVVYSINSYHYLLPYVQDGGTGEYVDPYGFAESGGEFGLADSVGAVVVLPTAVLGNGAETPSSQIYLGETAWQVYGLPPQISSTSATCSGCPVPFAMNSSGTLTINGLYLTDSGFDPAPTVRVSPSSSGLTLGTVTVVSDSQIQVNYQVGGNPNGTGPCGVTVTTGSGGSNPSPVQVGDPMPVITSINPATWNAGTVVSLIITGTGFGTSPTLSMQGAGINFTYACASSPGIQCNTQITATVTVSASTPLETVTITVTSNGYNGSGFLPAQSGESDMAQTSAEVEPEAPLAATIVLGQGAAACSSSQAIPTAVLVGQQISFTACLPSGAQASSESWAPALPPGTAVANYTASTASGTVQPVSSTTCGTAQNCAYNPFYWVGQGSNRQFTFTYTVGTGASAATSPPVIVTFSVSGPTGVTVAAIPPNVIVLAPPNNSPLPTSPLLIDGASNLPSMQFTASADAASVANGTYQWVQLLNSDVTNVLSSAGSKACTPLQQNGAGYTQALDTTYPYVVVKTTSVKNDTATDNPYTPLPSTWGEVARQFGATMYLMWIPNSAGTCGGGAGCTIPVPLGSTTWGFSGDAINTLIPQVNAGVSYPLWSLQCGSAPASVNPFQANSSFPQWTYVDSGGVGTCK